MSLLLVILVTLFATMPGHPLFDAGALPATIALGVAPVLAAGFAAFAAGLRRGPERALGIGDG